MVALHVPLHLIQGLAGHLAEQLVHLLLDGDDALGLNGDIGRLALGPTQGLMDHDLAVGQLSLIHIFCRSDALIGIISLIFTKSPTK